MLRTRVSCAIVLAATLGAPAATRAAVVVPAPSPSVVALPVTDVGPLSATLHVRVTGNGLPVTLTGRVNAMVAGTPPIPIGPVGVPADGDVALPVAGLQPGSGYRWTVTVTGPDGTALGRHARALGSFRTAPPRSMPRPVASTATAVYGSQVTLTGTLPGAAGLTAALQKQPFPFTAPFAAVAGAAGALDANGSYAFSVMALQRARYGVVVPGYALPRIGNTIGVRVRAAVVAHAAPAPRHRFAVSGRYAPGVRAAVSLFRVGHGRVDAPVATRPSGTTGRAFRFAARTLAPGRYEVRVTPETDTGLELSRSAPFTIPRR